MHFQEEKNEPNHVCTALRTDMVKSLKIILSVLYVLAVTLSIFHVLAHLILPKLSDRSVFTHLTNEETGVPTS